MTIRSLTFTHVTLGQKPELAVSSEGAFLILHNPCCFALPQHSSPGKSSLFGALGQHRFNLCPSIAPQDELPPASFATLNEYHRATVDLLAATAASASEADDTKLVAQKEESLNSQLASLKALVLGASEGS